jgi:Bax protein
MLKFKTLSILLCIFGLYLFACADTTENNCTDDGCPEFVSMIQELDAEFASYEVIPTITTESKDDFVYSLNSCITHLYKDVPLDQQIPRELIIAQAAIETGWGKSRFANEGNNLFGIRTWNKDDNWLLPIPWTEWPGWGVKVFKTKCDSVAHYINIINEVFAYEEFREVRARILEHGKVPNGLDLAPTLTKYASRSNYTDLIAELIKYNIRGVYEL